MVDKGDIVEQGTHDELIARGGFYASLYNSQFEGSCGIDDEEDSDPRSPDPALGGLGARRPEPASPLGFGRVQARRLSKPACSRASRGEA